MLLDRFVAAYPPDDPPSGVLVRSPDTDLQAQLVTRAGGQSFGNGIVRVHSQAESDRARGLLGHVFSQYRGCIPVAKDWLGRQFVLDSGAQTVLLLEPGSAQAFHTECGLDTLFDYAMLTDPVTFLASDLFVRWVEYDGCRPLPPHQCVSFKQPLFAGGRGIVDNLEISDEEVYWAVVAELKYALG
jgi:hypothetical protein